MKIKKRNTENLKEVRRALRDRRRRKLHIYENKPSDKKAKAKVSSGRQGVETPDGLIDEVIAARLLGLTPRTLQNRRSLRQRPDFVKRGRKVFYERSHIEELAALPSSQW